MRRASKPCGSTRVLTTVCLLAAASAAGTGPWDVEDQRTIEETFRFAAASDSNLLVIDNVSGSVRAVSRARRRRPLRPGLRIPLRLGGGPKMSFETLNGDVYIRNTDR